MPLSTVEWAVLCTVASLAVGVIGYFLKRTMNTTDTHGKEINEIKLNYAKQNTVDAHGGDIQQIKRTYVTKDELKEIKTELRDENKKLVADVSEIKDNYIRKDDFYRTISDLTRTVDKVYDFLIQERGGSSHGQE